MKKLLTITIVAAAMAVPSISFAGTNVFGVDTDAKKPGVTSQVSGGRVEQDHNSFYTTDKRTNNVRSSTGTQQVDIDALRVFGVQIAAK